MSEIPIFAHRGASAYALENSFAAFKKAKLLGADGIEIDIQQSSDDVLVVFHDADLVRLAGIKKSIADCSVEELQQYKLGRRFSRIFSRNRIHTFEEVMKWANKENMAVNIELKKPLLKNPQILKTQLSQIEIMQNSHISSFHLELLQLVKEIRPDVETALIVTKKFDWASVGLLDEIDAIHAHKKYYKQMNLKTCEEASKGVRFYNIKGNENFLKNPHPAVIGWITDYPDRVRKQAK